MGPFATSPARPTRTAQAFKAYSEKRVAFPFKFSDDFRQFQLTYTPIDDYNKLHGEEERIILRTSILFFRWRLL